MEETKDRQFNEKHAWDILESRNSTWKGAISKGEHKYFHACTNKSCNYTNTQKKLLKCNISDNREKKKGRVNIQYMQSL